MTLRYLLIYLPFRHFAKIFSAIIGIKPSIQAKHRTMHLTIAGAAIADKCEFIAIRAELIEHFGYPWEQSSLAFLGKAIHFISHDFRRLAPYYFGKVGSKRGPHSFRSPAKPLANPFIGNFLRRHVAFSNQPSICFAKCRTIDRHTVMKGPIEIEEHCSLNAGTTRKLNSIFCP